MTFYRDWEDRFVDFCLYRYLTDLAVQKNQVSPNYMLLVPHTWKKRAYDNASLLLINRFTQQCK